MKREQENSLVERPLLTTIYQKKFYPYKLLLYFLLGGITLMFLSLTAALLYSTYTSTHAPLELPTIFHLNTFVILLSSFTIHSVYKAVKNDNPLIYRTALSATFILGCVFIGFQFFGWREMFSSGAYITNNNSGAYLVLISGLHIFHVLAGLGVVSYYLTKAFMRINNPVETLLFATDPVQPMQAQLLSTYWHFVDFLWLYLYLFFNIIFH